MENEFTAGDWFFQYARGQRPGEEEDDGKPFDFWIQKTREYVFLEMHVVALGDGRRITAFINPDKLTYLSETDEADVQELAARYTNAMLIYDAVIVRNQQPECRYVRKDFERLLALDLNSVERAIISDLYVCLTKIYLIKDRNSGLVKIGRSNDPQYRLKTLIKQDTLMPSANEFELLFSWDDFAAKEVQLHHRFAAKRIRGEWFELSQQDIFAIHQQNF